MEINELKNRIKNNEIHGAIFDCDGVLLDSMGFWHSMPSRYVQVQGIIPPEDLINTIFTMSVEQGISYLKNKYNIVKSEQEIYQEMLGIMSDFYVNEVQAKPGVERLLRELNSHDIPCVIATASPRAPLTAALERLELLQYFSHFFTTNEIGKGKQDAAIYLTAAESIGSEPEHTLVFEDSRYAMETAKSAGFISIGVYDPISEKGNPGLKEVADIYVNSLLDLGF